MATERSVSLFVVRTWVEPCDPRTMSPSFSVLLPASACAGTWSMLHAELVQRVPWLNNCYCTNWEARDGSWSHKISISNLGVPAGKPLYVEVVPNYTSEELKDAVRREAGIPKSKELSWAELNRMIYAGPASVGLLYCDAPFLHDEFRDTEGEYSRIPDRLVIGWQPGYAGLMAELDGLDDVKGKYTCRLFGSGAAQGMELREDATGVLGTVYIRATRNINTRSKAPKTFGVIKDLSPRWLKSAVDAFLSHWSPPKEDKRKVKEEEQQQLEEPLIEQHLRHRQQWPAGSQLVRPVV